MATDDADAPASAAVRMLTDRALLLHVLSFADGLPACVLDLWDAMAAWSEQLPRWQRTQWLLDAPTLVRFAMLHDDRTMLLRLRGLVVSSASHYGAHPKLQLASAARFAIQYQNQELFQWLQVHVPEACQTTAQQMLDAAVCSGDLAWVKEVRAAYASECVSVSDLATSGAATLADMSLLQWLHATRLGSFSTRVMQHAVHCARFETVRFLFKIGCEPCGVDDAAECGNLEMVRFFHAHGQHEFDAPAMIAAAFRGHLDIVRYLYESKCRYWVGAVISAALQGRSSDVLEFLLGQHDIALTSDNLFRAVESGELEIVRVMLRHRAFDCLVEASTRARARGHDAVAEDLDAWVAQSSVDSRSVEATLSADLQPASKRPRH